MSWSAALEYKGLGQAASAASVAITLSAAAFAAGDFVVVLWDGEAVTAPTSATITDNSSGGPNTWTQDLFYSPGSTRAVGIWSTTIAHGGASLTFTVTPNTSASQNISVHHYASPGGTVSTESVAHNEVTGAAQTVTCGALTIATGPDLVVAVVDSPNTDISAAGTGFTMRTDITTGHDYHDTEDQLNVTANLTPAFGTSATPWTAGCAAYKYAASGPTNSGGAALMAGM